MAFVTLREPDRWHILLGNDVRVWSEGTIMTDRFTRRRLIAVSGTVCAAALAGCGDSGEDNETTDDGAGDETGTGDETNGEENGMGNETDGAENGNETDGMDGENDTSEENGMDNETSDEDM